MRGQCHVEASRPIRASRRRRLRPLDHAGVGGLELRRLRGLPPRPGCAARAARAGPRDVRRRPLRARPPGRRGPGVARPGPRLRLRRPADRALRPAASRPGGRKEAAELAVCTAPAARRRRAAAPRAWQRPARVARLGRRGARDRPHPDGGRARRVAARDRGHHSRRPLVELPAAQARLRRPAPRDLSRGDVLPPDAACGRLRVPARLHGRRLARRGPRPRGRRRRPRSPRLPPGRRRAPATTSTT